MQRHAAEKTKFQIFNLRIYICN